MARPELTNPQKRAKERRRQNRLKAEKALMEIVALTEQVRYFLNRADVPLQPDAHRDLGIAQSRLAKIAVEDKTRRQFNDTRDDQGDDDATGNQRNEPDAA